MSCACPNAGLQRLIRASESGFVARPITPSRCRSPPVPTARTGGRKSTAGKLGVVQEGALADLILVDGNPLENISLIADPDQRFLVIVKDGRVYKKLPR
jgi:hypothetical protein